MPSQDPLKSAETVEVSNFHGITLTLLSTITKDLTTSETTTHLETLTTMFRATKFTMLLDATLALTTSEGSTLSITARGKCLDRLLARPPLLLSSTRLKVANVSEFLLLMDVALLLLKFFALHLLHLLVFPELPANSKDVIVSELPGLLPSLVRTLPLSPLTLLRFRELIANGLLLSLLALVSELDVEVSFPTKLSVLTTNLA